MEITSGKFMNTVLSKDLTSTEKLLLLCLIDYADKDGIVKRSNNSMGYFLRVANVTIAKGLQKLELTKRITRIYESNPNFPSYKIRKIKIL